MNQHADETPNETANARTGDPSLYDGARNMSINAIRAVFIANGGGVLVLLAFFGNVWQSGEGRGIIVALVPTLVSFLAGMSLALVTVLLAYVAETGWASHHFVGDKVVPRSLVVLQHGALVVGIAGMVAFVAGSWLAASAFSTVLN